MTHQARRFASLMALTPLLLVVGADYPTPTSLERAEVLLTEFVAMTAGCGTTTCGECIGTPHFVTQTSGGESKGPYHNCIGTEMGCEYHACGETGGMAMISDLSRVLPRLNAQDLSKLQEPDDAFLVNRERGAVRLTGCGGLVVLTLPLSQAQADQLL